MAKFGLLTNSPDNDHSYFYTSPLKYFEYLHSGLSIIAVDFPSHRSLPISEKISFFENGSKDDFINILKKYKKSEPLSKDQLYITSLDYRAKQLIKFIISTPGGI